MVGRAPVVWLERECVEGGAGARAIRPDPRQRAGCTTEGVRGVGGGIGGAVGGVFIVGIVGIVGIIGFVGIAVVGIVVVGIIVAEVAKTALWQPCNVRYDCITPRFA